MYVRGNTIEVIHDESRQFFPFVSIPPWDFHFQYFKDHEAESR